MALGLTTERLPELRDPALVVAFAGWTDAGEAASAAVRWLVRRLPGQRIGSIDAEHYHVFTSSRPTVRLVGGERRITWPIHDFYVHTDPAKPRDLVLLVAKEPEVCWRAYGESVMELAGRLGVTTLVSFGAFLGETIHNRPVPISGFATTAALRHRLLDIGAAPSNYEGPTGMASVILDFARREDLPAISLWAAIPHYLPTTANPKGALALVRALARVLDLDLNLERLEAAAAFFQRQVDSAFSHDRRATGYLRELERRSDAEPSERGGELPSAEEVIRDLETFLRSSRGSEESDEG